MKNAWKLLTFVSTGSLAAVLVVGHGIPNAEASGQPHLSTSRDKLKEVRKELEKAGTGAHSIKALGKIDDAIGELKAAIDAKEEDGDASGGGGEEQIVDGRWGIHGGKVHDTQSGLIWQQTHASSEQNLEDARSHCKALKLDGGGWRLPTKDELLGIVVKGSHPTIDSTAFPNTPSSDFWTSTPDKSGSFQVTVDFFTGSDSLAPPAITHWVRCVRAK